MRRPTDVPAYLPNLYSRRAIVEPYPHYTRLRELGQVVWLTEQREKSGPGSGAGAVRVGESR
jgi:hypothetical protein